MTNQLAKLAQRIRETQAAKPDPGAPSEYSLQAALARKESAKSKLAEMEVRERSSKLMETALVRAACAEAEAVMRAHLAPLPAILAPQIAALSDENLVRLLLEDHIEQALGELAEKFAGMAT